MYRRPFWLLTLAGIGAIAFGDQQLTECLSESARGNPRTVLRIDPVEADLIAGRLDTSAWTSAKANKDGGFSGGAFGSGYALFEVPSETDKVVFLEAKGNSMVYVNGEPRVGDVYSFGYASLPIQLRKGKNQLLFAVTRGSFSAKLVDAPKPYSLDVRDATLPDIVQGEKELLHGALIVRNATGEDVKNLSLEVGGVTKPTGFIPSTGIRKVAFSFKPNATGKYTLNLRQGGKIVDSTPISVRIRDPKQTHKRTFISQIDESVQYYAVNPAQAGTKGNALALSLHGASVEAMGQCDAYGPKQAISVVCPTNRRPFGFDWEDVGRLDALEVLDIAKKRLQTDPSQTYLTGHSMGGHGTWNIGALFPDKFAAIAPCAGWISFNTYAGGATYPNSVEGEMFRRAGYSSDTLRMKPNLRGKPIFVNHGDADDNVPVTEARRMREELAENKQLQWNEQKGGGHWYDTDPEPGANVEDHAPIFTMFSQSRIPALNSVRHIDFVTPNPYISPSCHWVSVDSQNFIGAPSTIKADSFPGLRKFVVNTENVASYTLDATVLIGTGAVEIVWNGTSVKQEPVNNRLKLGVDQAVGKSFKASLDRNVVFVYGTHGSTEENNWMKARAKFDAEQFWYRGNSGAGLMSDDEYLKSGKGRNAMCYSVGKGNAAFDPTWDLSKRSSDSLLLRRVEKTGSSLSFYHANSVQAARLSERIPLFSAGVAIPDILVINPTMLKDGIGGVEALGFTLDDLIWKQ